MTLPARHPLRAQVDGSSKAGNRCRGCGFHAQQRHRTTGQIVPAGRGARRRWRAPSSWN